MNYDHKKNIGRVCLADELSIQLEHWNEISSSWNGTARTRCIRQVYFRFIKKIFCSDILLNNSPKLRKAIINTKYHRNVTSNWLRAQHEHQNNTSYWWNDTTRTSETYFLINWYHYWNKYLFQMIWYHYRNIGTILLPDELIPLQEHRNNTFYGWTESTWKLEQCIFSGNWEHKNLKHQKNIEWIYLLCGLGIREHRNNLSLW